MIDNGRMVEENYSKDVGKGTFVLEWIPLLIVGTLFFFCLWTVLDIVIGVLTESGFSIRWYLVSESILADPDVPFLVAFVLFLFEGRRRYRLIKEKFFASINSEKLMLKFKRNSFLWNDIRTVHLEGNRKLTVTFLDKGKRKRRTFDLKWLIKKKDFIFSLKNNCTARDIPFNESNLTFISQIRLFFSFLDQYPFF